MDLKTTAHNVVKSANDEIVEDFENGERYAERYLVGMMFQDTGGEISFDEALESLKQEMRGLKGEIRQIIEHTLGHANHFIITKESDDVVSINIDNDMALIDTIIHDIQDNGFTIIRIGGDGYVQFKKEEQ